MGRVGVLFKVATQGLNLLVEVTTALLGEQFAVVIECVLPHTLVAHTTIDHREGLHSLCFIPHTEVAVGQMVGGILGERIIGTASTTQVTLRIGPLATAV